MITVIIPTSSHISSLTINSIIQQIKKQTLDIEIIVSNQGIRTDGNLDCDCLVQFPISNTFQLSRARNEGAKRSSGDWLAFTDCDIYYDEYVFEDALSLEHDAIRGNTIQNIYDIGDKPLGSKYKCGAAPLIIKRGLFFDIGGYCEKYKGWGFEDSDLEHKLIDFGKKPLEYDSGGYHVLSIHNQIKQNSWKQSSEDNRIIFNMRKKQSIEDRIKFDTLHNA